MYSFDSLSADEAQPPCDRSSLTAREAAKIRRIDVVHHRHARGEDAVKVRLRRDYLV